MDISAILVYLVYRDKKLLHRCNYIFSKTVGRYCRGHYPSVSWDTFHHSRGHPWKYSYASHEVAVSTRNRILKTIVVFLIPPLHKRLHKLARGLLIIAVENAIELRDKIPTRRGRRKIWSGGKRESHPGFGLRGARLYFQGGVIW